MLPENLLAEKETRVKTLEEARGLLKTDFAVSYLHTSLEHLEIHPDGTVDVNNQNFPFTPLFLEALAQDIGMPLSYAHDIDFELFQVNFDRRKQERCSGVMVCVSRGGAVHLCRAGYYPARTCDVIEHLPEEVLRLRFHEAALSDRGVELSWANEGARIEPVPGDVILAGLRISNSETGFRGLKAATFTLRLVCSNGAVAADEKRVVRWSNDRRTAYMRSIDKFCNELKVLEIPREELAERYAGLIGRRVTDRELAALWRRVRRVLPPEEVDSLVGLGAQERQGLLARVRAYRDPGRSEPTDIDAYEVHNRITAGARSRDFQRRRRLEEIGGNMLRGMSLN